MKKHLKITLIFAIIFSCLIGACMPAYALAGWAEMDEKTGNATVLSAFIMFIFFWPLMLIDIILGILLYLITGVIPYSGPVFSHILGGIFSFIFNLLCLVL